MADTKNTQKMSPQGYNYDIPDYNENPWYDEDETGERPSELPIASKTQAGIVKIGDGVNVSDDGTISVDATGGGTAKTPVITASATVSDTVGTPAVDVIKTGTDENPNFEFSFSNLKGEKGDRGEAGESITGPQGPKGDPGESITGPQGPAGEAGYSPTATVIQDADGATITITSKPGDVEETTTATVKNGKDGEDGSPGKDGVNGVSPTVNATGSTESGALAGTITGADGSVINVYNGARGEKGETGSGGETPTIDTTNVVNNVSMTNENGVYTLSQSKGDPASPTTTEIGTIEIPTVDTDNLIAEVKDSVVSNDASGYDYHAIQETENNGTQNDVSKFYLAQKQITDISATGNQLNIKTVNQAGTEETKSVEMANEVDLTNVVNDVEMLATGDGRSYTLVQLKGDPEKPTSSTIGSIDVPSQVVKKLEKKGLTNYSAITAYVLNGDNNMYFATADNQYGLVFSPIMDVDMGYNNSSHTLTLYGAAAAMHTNGSAIGSAYYETKTTKNIVIPIATESTYGLVKTQGIKGYVSNNYVEPTVTQIGQNRYELGAHSTTSFDMEGTSEYAPQNGYILTGVEALSVYGALGYETDSVTVENYKYELLPQILSFDVNSDGKISATILIHNTGSKSVWYSTTGSASKPNFRVYLKLHWIKQG